MNHTDKLDRIKALLDATIAAEGVTPGPWSDESDWPRVFSDHPDYFCKKVCQVPNRITEKNKTGSTPDTRFIAHSRTLTPELARGRRDEIAWLEEASKETDYDADCGKHMPTYHAVAASARLSALVAGFDEGLLAPEA